jgi:glucosylceramidase
MKSKTSSLMLPALRGEISRRSLLGLPMAEAPMPAPVNEQPSVKQEMRITGSLNVWVTDPGRRITPAKPIAWGKAEGLVSQNDIVIRPEGKNQTILGFGAALTDAACSLLHRMNSDARTRLFHNLFTRSEMNLNVCRICIGSSDCSTAVFSYDDGPVDPDLKRFSVARDEEHVLPILREIQELNSGLLFFASPWSPPGWMKSNGSMLGGCMRHTYMASYADYFLRFLRAYENAGVAVHAVTVQNEVDADQDGTMPACAWPQDYEADFVTMHLGPLFQRAGVSTKIWIVDHNYNLWGRAIGELETPDVRKFTNAIAWHGYEGEPEWIRRVQDAFPDAEMYWTEGGPNYQSPDYQTEWVRWGETFSRILRNCCRSITAWTLLSDEHGRPYAGSAVGGVGGAMLMNSKTKEISYSGMFWALAHFSRFVQRGANRIDSDSMNQDLKHCAFENPDGSLVVVLPNSGTERVARIRLADRIADVPVPANSLTTIVCPASAQGA